MNATATKAKPTSENGRVRSYLTEREVEKLMSAARKHSRYGARDATMILMAYRHGLRASELCQLGWSEVELRWSPSRSTGEGRPSRSASVDWG